MLAATAYITRSIRANSLPQIRCLHDQWPDVGHLLPRHLAHLGSAEQSFIRAFVGSRQYTIQLVLGQAIC